MAEQILCPVMMERFRCHRCRRYFMVEQGSPSSCPACAESDLRIERMKLTVVQEERDEAALAHARTVSALKGAITKAKKR